MSNPDSIRPFHRNEKTVFDEPWHAQVLAIADTLVQSGRFTAAQWAEALGAERSASDIRQDPDSAETYYQCALNALETLLAATSKIDTVVIDKRSKEWARAYRATPHGQPVLLAAGRD